MVSHDFPGEHTELQVVKMVWSIFKVFF